MADKKPETKKAPKTEKTEARIKLLKFTAKWCGPCKEMEPHVVKFEQAHAEVEVQRLDIDTDKAQRLAERYEISSVPVALFVDRTGFVLAARYGYQTLSSLEKAYETAKNKADADK